MSDGRKLLLVSPFFYPESISTGKYNTSLAEALRDRGVNVTVVASHPLYPSWLPNRSDAQLPGISIVRGGAKVRYANSPVLRRIVLEGWFAWHVLRTALEFRDEFDDVVAVLPPSLFSLVLSSMFGKAHKVGIVHDLQGVQAKSHGGFVARLAAVIEKAAFRRFDRLIFLSKSMAEQAAYAVESDNVAVCYPFVTLKEGLPSGTLHALFPRDRKHVVYAGALGRKQNPDKLLRIFDSAASELPEVMFHVFSDGPEFARLQQEYAGRPGIVFHPLVAEEDLAELYLHSDVQVIPQAEGTADGAFPSKLPNLLASGCAVLAICDRESELGDVLRTAGTGSACNSWDPATVIESLRGLLERGNQESHQDRAALAKPVIDQLFGIGGLLDLILERGRETTAAEIAREEEPQLT